MVGTTQMVSVQIESVLGLVRAGPTGTEFEYPGTSIGSAVSYSARSILRYREGQLVVFSSTWRRPLADNAPCLPRYLRVRGHPWQRKRPPLVPGLQ
eukprot:2253076-Rhodomonas_salina.2